MILLLFIASLFLGKIILRKIMLTKSHLKTTGRTCLVLSAIAIAAGKTSADGWSLSYSAGYTDRNGAWAGGSEIMHIVPQKGRRHALNGDWRDSRWKDRPYPERQSAQVLRLDSADAQWQVDLDTGRSNNLDSRYMKGNILKSITFTTDGEGNPLLPPRNLLVAGAGKPDSHVSIWVRNDTTGQWTHQLVKEGAGGPGIRWVPRDMELYRDKATGAERLFLLLGNPGILSGVFDESQPTGIRWDTEVEFPRGKPFASRPLGITQANDRLYFSAEAAIYERQDGGKPAYRKVFDMTGRVNPDVGGVRGLSTVSSPGGKGDSIIFVWAPNGRTGSQVKRLDPDGRGGYTVHDEVSMRSLMAGHLGIDIGYTLAGLNEFYPFKEPRSGSILHLLGVQGHPEGLDHLKWELSRLYAGAPYAIRSPDGSYGMKEVNGRWQPGNRVLVTPRTFALSPFGDNTIYIGGFDASFKQSDNMAWIYRAPLKSVLEK